MVRNLKPKKCNKCGTEFTPNNGRQVYCFTCSPSVGGYNKDARRKHYTSKAGHGIDLRVEYLGQLHDRHVELLRNKDREGLLKLADEYMKLKHPCTVMAKAIKMQAESVQ